MSSILAQIGARIGQEFNSISSSLQGLAGEDTYSEIGYDANGNVSTITTYTDSTKATLVKTKTLTYTSGSLTGIVVTDSSGTTVLTQTLAYDATSGDLDSIEKDYA
jgi:hypothetical protein